MYSHCICECCSSGLWFFSTANHTDRAYSLPQSHGRGHGRTSAGPFRAWWQQGWHRLVHYDECSHESRYRACSSCSPTGSASPGSIQLPPVDMSFSLCSSIDTLKVIQSSRAPWFLYYRGDFFTTEVISLLKKWLLYCMGDFFSIEVFLLLQKWFLDYRGDFFTTEVISLLQTWFLYCRGDFFTTEVISLLQKWFL